MGSVEVQLAGLRFTARFGRGERAGPRVHLVISFKRYIIYFPLFASWGSLCTSLQRRRVDRRVDRRRS